MIGRHVVTKWRRHVSVRQASPEFGSPVIALLWTKSRRSIALHGGFAVGTVGVEVPAAVALVAPGAGVSLDVSVELWEAGRKFEER